MGRLALERGGSECDLLKMSQTELLVAITVLIVVEINHLKWIWWEHWHCRACTVVHKDCSCGRTNRWVMYL